MEYKVALVQGLYFLITGIWPILNMKTFLMIRSQIGFMACQNSRLDLGYYWSCASLRAKDGGN